MSWLRRAPPSAVGGDIPSLGGSPHGFFAVTIGFRRSAPLPVVDGVEARAVAAAHVQLLVGPEGQAPDRMARVLLAPVLDQHLFGAEIVRAAHREAARGVR